MRATLMFFAVCASLVFAEDTARVFNFHHVESDQDLKEIAVVIRTVAEITDAQVDVAKKTISVRGNATSVSIAEWLFLELDRRNLPESAMEEFKVARDGSDVARVFYLKNAATVQEFQEIATSIRTVAEIRKMFTYNSARALVLRGTADQIAGAAFVIGELDQPAGAKRTESRVHPMIDTNNRGETAVRIFYLPYTSTVQEFQEVATMIRTVGEIRRTFTYNSARAIITRGTSDQIALTQWLVTEIEKPVSAEVMASQPYTYPAVYGEGATIVRVFYVKDTPTVAAFQQIATQIRTKTQIRRVFTYNSSRAITVRGTSDQIAAAEQLLKERQIASK